MKHMVSIIIPCYNDKHYIERAINSAVNQKYPNKEVVIIDDGSNFETRNILRKLEPHIDNLIFQENTGVVKARNRAITESIGEYILTHDSDDFFDPSFVEKAVRILQENKEVGMVTCWVSLLNSELQQIKVSKPSGSDASKAIFYNNAPGCLLFRRKCWEEVGGYDENLMMGNEDWEFNIAVTKRSWKIHVIPEVLFHCQQKKQSRNRSAKTYQKKIREYTFKKHQDLLIGDMDKTIDYFLNEIEHKEKEIAKLRDSKNYKLGEKILAPIRIINKWFHR